MKKSYDAIVIGAGVAGLPIARELAKSNERVLLVEREREGGKASRAAAGILDPYSEAREESPLLRLGLKALEFYPSFLKEWVGDAALKKVEYEKLGILYLALSPEDEAFLKDRSEWQKSHGLRVEFLRGSEVRRLEPTVSGRTQSGVLYPEIPKLNAKELTRALFKAAQSAGVEFRTSVKEVSVWTEKGKLKGIKMAQDAVEAPLVILASGSWTGLDPRLGIKVNVSPVRGQILLLRSKPSLYPRHILHTARYAYIVPWPKGRLLIGSTLEHGEFEDRVTPEGKEDILSRASEMVEEIRSLPIESSWAGLRPYADGGMPLIGPTRVPGLFLATGYYRSGILIGPLAGKLLSEGIVSGKFSSLLKPFYPKERKK